MPRIIQMLHPGILIIALVSLISGNLLKAQEEEIKLFKLTKLSGALTFNLEQTTELETNQQQIYRDISRKYLAGGLLLNTEGSVIHSNLIAFRLDANIIANRSGNRQSTDSVINKTINNNYNISVSILQKKKLNFDFYTLRDYSTYDNAFQDRYFNVSKNLGASMEWKGKHFPFKLTAYKSQIKTDSLSYSEREEKIKNVEFEISLVEKTKVQSNFSFVSKDYLEALFHTHYQSNEIIGRFFYYSSPKRVNTLSSIFFYHQMSGDFNFNTMNLQNQAIFYLNKDLSTVFYYKLSKDDALNRSLTNHELNGTLRHRLYESLESSLMIGGRAEKTNFQNAGIFQEQISLNYTKKIPSGSVQFNFINRNDFGRYRSKSPLTGINESYSFVHSDSIMLFRQGIRLESIRIVDSNLMTLYVVGIDYLVDVLPNALVVTRLPGGAIPQGASIEIYYEYLSYPDFDLRLHYTQINSVLTIFKYFNFYYRRGNNNQNIISEYNLPPFDDHQNTILGAGIISRYLNLDYNHERYHSVVSDYRSRNFRVSVNLNINRVIRLSGYMALNQLDYVPKTFFNHLETYSLDCLFTFGNHLSANAVYRKILFSTPSYSRYRDGLVAKLQWNVRKISVLLFYEHALNEYEDTLHRHDYFNLMIRRSF